MNSISKAVSVLISGVLLLSGATDAAVVTATFNSTSTVPVTAASYTATGNSVVLALNFEPIPGTSLTVVNNTGFAHIQGVFDNLAHGQVVALDHAGVTYSFVANYYGGTGNDLQLQWANTRLLGWGNATSGALGNNSNISPPGLVATDMTGLLASKTFASVTGGNGFSLALCTDGTLAAWGDNHFNQLGRDSPLESRIPVSVDRSGVLAGKTVIAISARWSHSLALCSDGSLVSWGVGSVGQLGNNTTEWESGPVMVDRSGVLAGKSVIAISAGLEHSLVLCSDGTLAAWGSNHVGQLGNNSTINSSVPVLVDRSGVLSRKTVIAISAGGGSNLALCSDGTLAAWGYNEFGQLGNNTKVNSLVPILVNRTGVLAGKTITAVSAGMYHGLVLTADGVLAAWGDNLGGQLGNNSTTKSSLPVLVDRTGVLAGKTVHAIETGYSNNLAYCSDGSLVTWGSVLTVNAVPFSNPVPVLVGTSLLKPGERFVSRSKTLGVEHALVVVASPPAPKVATLAVDGINDTSASLHGSVNANGSTAAIRFEYGLTTDYEAKIASIPPLVTGTTDEGVSATLTGLLSGSTYHYRVVADGPGGEVKGADMTFTTTTLARLKALSLSVGTLDPPLAPETNQYAVAVPSSVNNLHIVPQPEVPGATVTINGAAVDAGGGLSINLTEGINTIVFVVTSVDGLSSQNYTLAVTRLPQTFRFQNAGQVGASVTHLVATGNTADIALDFAPPTGTTLTLINHTGIRPIEGYFSNLSQGQPIKLTYGGATYAFVANYFGGSGNDLVLQWAGVKVLSWGFDEVSDSQIPSPVDQTGILSGKSIIALAAGSTFSVAACSDGTLAAWGENFYSQLGNNSNVTSKVPVAVDRSGILANKTVVRLAAAGRSVLALCSDGTLATWGYDPLGTIFTQKKVPVVVNLVGALTGKRVVDIATGGSHSLALCSDGTVAAWGINDQGQLGDYSLKNSTVPVEVNRSGLLARKSVVAIAAGQSHSLALCSDGTLAAWGRNSNGELGNGTTTVALVPAAVLQSGVLNGKTVTAVCAGDHHNLALCSDGTLAAWGYNYFYGQLGDNSRNDSTVPVLVDRTGVLLGRTVTGLSAGYSHSLAMCSDGTLAAWGYNFQGELGINNKLPSTRPVQVDSSAQVTGAKFVAVAGGRSNSLNRAHTVALLALPLQTATTLPASAIRSTGAKLQGQVNPNDNAVTVAFEYGLTNSYGLTVAAISAVLSGQTDTAVSAIIGGLLPSTTYHFRTLASGSSGVAVGEDMTFTTRGDDTLLAALSLNSAALAPGFVSAVTHYVATLPFATTSVTVRPVTAQPDASVQVNGGPVASAGESQPIPLPVGNTTITVRVTSEDGIAFRDYIITVTRLPQTFVFNSAGDVPVRAGEFSAAGHPVRILLAFAPQPGTTLTMIDNTGLGPIYGTFGNLAQGQRVTLSHGGTTYDFVANYFGGTGNDLVLQWAGTKLLAWGSNSYGQLGDGSNTRRLTPVATSDSGALEGKTIIAVSTGYLHSLALCSDGTLASWGYNVQGQLGDGGQANRKVPAAVDLTSLEGRTVIAISSGKFHNLALCDDGRVAAWGYNNSGQLGTGDKLNSRIPVLVNPVGALAGKQVVSVSAGAYHSFALCSDGSVTAWGYNDEGELGDGTNVGSMVPVAVDTAGILSGRRIARISAGQYHMLALCTDGTIVSWGYNHRGQLGNSSTTASSSPVKIGSTGALAGKTVVALGAGGSHSLALCSDGSLAAWGYNNLGQLGTTGISQSTSPLTVTLPQGLAGRLIVGISAGAYHNLLSFADGTMATWGDNADGQLGNNSMSKSATAVRVKTGTLKEAGPILFGTSGSAALHNLAVAAPPAPEPAAIEVWRAENFGMAAASAADAAYCADCDHDGIPNLVEYAFGLDPNANSAGELPQAHRVGDRIVLKFNTPQGVSGIGYGAEWSPNLQPTSWTELPDSGSGDQHIFSMPVDAAPRLFLRLKVWIP